MLDFLNFLDFLDLPDLPDLPNLPDLPDLPDGDGVIFSLSPLSGLFNHFPQRGCSRVLKFYTGSYAIKKIMMLTLQG